MTFHPLLFFFMVKMENKVYRLNEIVQLKTKHFILNIILKMKFKRQIGTGN